VTYKTLDERRAEGLDAANLVPVASHAEWAPDPMRDDPVSLISAQNETRVPWLVPVRHGRMQVSPFTFYRGTARIMAADLATTQSSGLDVQLVGDAHLSNFGVYASPERKLVFDANDFDETLAGPFEWDLKRLAASFMIAAQHLDLGKKAARKVTTEVTESYRQAMLEFGNMGLLDLWYDHISVDQLHRFARIPRKEMDRRLAKFSQKAQKQTNLRALDKLAYRVDDQFRIRSQAPVLVPVRELLDEYQPDDIEQMIHEAFEDYVLSLRVDRRTLVERYRLVDYAVKVVGVGSVGTRCFVLLFEGRDQGDPLFLQAKEATASVLEEHLTPSPFVQHGERIVHGQRQIQAQSDILLGWTTGRAGRDYYVRQLKDWKGAFDVETATADSLGFYGRLCGYTLARGHARSGDPVSIAAYLGDTDEFARAITAFSEQYADQATADYATFRSAIEDGTIEAATEE
jgi:uncharacterized protein (DUF2252 family)